MISQSYRELEIIVVDDRSTDRTPEILKELSSINVSRLKLLKGEEPPIDWMGKIFALHQAKQASSGEWLVSVDADVIYSRKIISSCLSFALSRNLDALSLLPEVKMKSYWEAVVIPAMSWLSLMRVSTTQANRKSSKACFGYRNFILFRRNAHDDIGGFEVYKNDILDDCMIMEMLKSHGYNVMVVDGSKLMHSRMYNSLREIILGFAKNSFASLHFSIPRTIAVILAEMLLVLFPLIYLPIEVLLNGIVLTPSLLMASVSVTLFFFTMFAFGLKMGVDARFYLFYPIGHAVSIAIIAFSMMSFLFGKGVPWKERMIRTKRQLNVEIEK